MRSGPALKRKTVWMAFILLLCHINPGSDSGAKTGEFLSAQDQILVKFKTQPGFKAKDSVRISVESEFNLRELKRYSFIGVHLYRTLADKSETIAALKNSPHVEYVEPDYLRFARDTFPDDPGFGSQWGLHNTGQNGGTLDADIDGPEAWDLTTGSTEVVVAVIDSGIEYNHPDLRNNLWENPGEIVGNGQDDDVNGYVDDIYGVDAITGSGNPLDDDGHGTEVAGVIAASGDNGIGVAGVCWTCKIMALRFLSKMGGGTVSDEIECIQYAVNHGAHIINGSFGEYSFSQAEKDAIEAAGSLGILCVFAVGNEGRDNDVNPHYPSAYESDNIIAVAVSDDNDELAGWSDYGLNSVDAAAPGAEILTTTLNNDYGIKSGASYASPHVAGIAALLKAFDPALTRQEIKGRLFGSVEAQSSMGGKLLTGGRVNAYRSLVPGENRILILQSNSNGTTSPSPGTYTYPKNAETTIWALPDLYYEFDRWQGSVPQIQQSSNPLTIQMDISRALVANFRKTIYAPLHFTGREEENRSLSQIEHIHVLNWQPNPLNIGIARYRIYEVVGGVWRLLSAVDSDTTEYWHRDVIEDRTYSYALVAVDSEEREGPPAFLIL